ncbi:MAG TPA: hypothetical protein DDW34_09845 [Clostridium sp.]|nr:hypothetical protein [Clostridium sp.]
MRTFLSNKRECIHITLTVSGREDSERKKVAEEIREAIQKRNRRHKYIDEQLSKVSYEIIF